MKKVSVSLFSLNELSPEAKKRAIEKEREFLSSQWDGEYTKNDAKDIFTLLGYDIDKIYYSGFASQGDGACFEGTWRASQVQPGKAHEYAPQDTKIKDLATEIEVFAAKYPELSFSVNHSGHYYHEFCTTFDIADEFEMSDKDFNDIEKQLIEFSRALMKWLYRRLESDYFSDMEDEQIEENINANDRVYLASGAPPNFPTE